MIEYDFLGIFNRLASFRDIENHMGLHLFPQAAGQLKLALSHHGRVDCPHRGSGYNIDFDSKFGESLPHTGFIGTSGTAAGKYQCGFLFNLF